MTRPRLIMTLLVRDEADIVAQNVAWHLSQGVDHVIATDNGSTDGTADALRPFLRDGSVTLLSEPSDAYLQDVWTTRMALLAREEHGADWVLCNDADEFWRAPSGDLHDVLPEGDVPPAMLICRRHNMIAPRDALSTGAWANTLVYRPVDPPALPRAPQTPAALRAVKLDHPYFQYRMPPKLLFRTRGLVAIEQGAHDGRYGGTALERAECPVEIFHYPVRSSDEFALSVRRIGTALRRRPAVPLTISWKYRRWLEMTERAGSIWPALAEALPDRERLNRDLAAGRVVRDLSMCRALSRLDVPPSLPDDRRTAMPARQTPHDMGTAILVIGPDEATDTALADILVGRGAAPPLSPGPQPHDLLHEAIRVEMARDRFEFRGEPAGWFDRRIAVQYRETLFDTLIEGYADLEDAVVHGSDLGALLPLWSGMARDRQIGLRAVIAIGSPSEDARVCQAASGLPLSIAALVWARRALEAERNSRALPRRVILRDALLDDWKTCADGIGAALSSNTPAPRQAPDDRMLALLAPLRARKPFSVSATLADPALPDLVKEVFETMRALAAGADPADLVATLDRLGASLDQACALLGPALADAAAVPNHLSDNRTVAATTQGAIAQNRYRIKRLKLLIRCRAKLTPASGVGLRKALRDRLSPRAASTGAVREAPEFDPEWYLSAYPDVAVNGVDPAFHFLRFGAREGRNPGPAFDTLRYYETYPEVLDSGQLAFMHYLRHGRNEGRAIFPAEPFPQ